MKTLRKNAYQFLRWLDKYAKTDMVYITKGSSWLLLSKGFLMVVSFLFALALANLLPSDTFGLYKFVLSLAGIIGSLSLSGMGPALMRAVSRGYEGMLKPAFLNYLKWGSLMSLAAFGISTYYLIQGDTVLALALLITGIFIPLSESTTLYNAFLTGKKLFKKQAYYSSLNNLIPPIFLVASFLLTSNLLVILLVYFVSTTLASAIPFVLTLKKEVGNNEKDPSIFSYSKHLSVMDILGSIALHLDKVLIFHYLGAIEVAVYTFALAIPQQFSHLNRVLKSLIFPKLSTKTFKDIQNVIPGHAKRYFVFMILVVIVYFFISPHIYKIFFPQYENSIPYSQYFSLTLLFFPIMFFNQSLVAQEKKKELYITKTTSNIIRIAGLSTLLPLFGIFGAISAILISKLVNMVLILFYFKRS